MSIGNLFLRANNQVLSAFAQLPFGKKQLYSRVKNILTQPEDEQISLALGAYFNIENSIYDEAEKCFNHIETERKKLLADTTIIKRLDFGAGAKTSVNKKQIAVSGLCKSASMPRKYAKLLYYLIRYVKPEICVELGTCLGISAAYQASALKANSKGKLISIEGDPASAEIAKSTLDNLHISASTEILTGRFTEVLPKVLTGINKTDFAFIDGHHNGEATLNYYEMLKQKLRENSILIFDDIDWSDDMQTAWENFVNNEEFSVCIDLGRLGLCVYNPEIKAKTRLSVKI